jgi:RHS repeat-associated protein
MFGRISRERLVSVDAKLSLGALDFSPLHHSLAVAHKTPIIISNYRADDPSMGNFGKISRMGWFLQSANTQLNPAYDVGFNCVVSEIDYIWGNDISGAREGACGIGGLLYLKRNGVVYIPFYDAYGNVLGYTDAHGNVVAEYTYDAFGKIVGKSGAMADDFAFRFSTKYYDAESALYYYTYRYYKPNLMRWLTEDPIAEDGGLNLYAFCGNNPVSRYDKDGRAYFAYRPLDNPVTHMTGIMAASSEFMKKKNWVVAHEQLIFEDGGSSVNIGYFDAPIGGNNPRQDEFHFQTQYVPIEGKGAYNDCVMREAVKNVTPRPYNLWTWAGRSTGQYNCQDYADDLRSEYYRLLLDIKIRCKCNLK